MKLKSIGQMPLKEQREIIKIFKRIRELNYMLDKLNIPYKKKVSKRKRK